MNTLKFNQIEFNHIGEQSSMLLQESGGSEYVYFSLNGRGSQYADAFSSLEKIRTENGIEILPIGLVVSKAEQISEILACCIDLNLKITFNGELKKIKDYPGYLDVLYQAYLPITEKEFYSISE